MPPKPKTAPATPAQRRAEAAAPPPSIDPAPHNGSAYGSRRPVRRAEGQKQLSQRIPGELFDRLAKCTEDTGVPQRRLLLDALEAELERRGY